MRLIPPRLPWRALGEPQPEREYLADLGRFSQQSPYRDAMQGAAPS